MSLYDDFIERDSKGMVRVPLIKLDERGCKKLIEFIYLNADNHPNFGYRERPETFGEYGKISRVSGKKTEKANKNWSWKDVKIVLENPLEDVDTIAQLTGRSYMSINIQRADVELKFKRWVEENNNLVAGLDHKQQVELYGSEGYVARRGDLI